MENNNDKFWMAITDEEGLVEVRWRCSGGLVEV